MESLPNDLWEAAKLAGPFGALLTLVMWWLERADRLRLQRERDNLLERVLTSMAVTSMAIEKVILMINSAIARRVDSAK